MTGWVSDDGLPSSNVTSWWSQVSGPGTVSFGSPTVTTTYASFSAAGVYTLRLTGSDTALTGADDVVITVNAAPTGTGTEIYPGTDIQSMINANGAGTYYVLKSGVHRMQMITPKSGDTLAGESGAVLSGARLLTSFTRSGSYWVASGQTQQGTPSGSELDKVCRSGSPRCGYPEDLFINNVPQKRVGTLVAVGPGKWFFDYAGDRIYFWDDPTGKTVETSVTPRAFNNSNATGVTLSNLIFEKYATPTGGAAVTLGTGWVMKDSAARFNHYSGVFTNSRSLTQRSNISQNGCFGFQGAGDNIVVDGRRDLI